MVQLFEEMPIWLGQECQARMHEYYCLSGYLQPKEMSLYTLLKHTNSDHDCNTGNSIHQNKLKDTNIKTYRLRLSRFSCVGFALAVSL